MALDADREFAQEASVRNQLENLLSQEKVFWAQRAKSKLLALGDKNAKYFHKSLKIKRHGSRSKVFKTLKESGQTMRTRFT